jgi:hypothetical protein
MCSAQHGDLVPQHEQPAFLEAEDRTGGPPSGLVGASQNEKMIHRPSGDHAGPLA